MSQLYAEQNLVHIARKGKGVVMGRQGNALFLSDFTMESGVRQHQGKV